MYSDAIHAPAAVIRSLGDRIGSFVAAIDARQRAKRDRVRLSQMSDHMLKDIGLTRYDVRQL